MRDPGGVLGEIVARKRIDLAARYRRGVPSPDGAPVKSRSLKAALSRPGARFVMEVKRASPSRGAIRADADPRALALAYAPAADAISVLTDTPYFGGSMADLAAVRRVYGGPILAKDFMIDPRQVAEARAHGADAILVMLSVLEDHEAAIMLAEARRLGMEALVETHDADEVRRALALGAEIIGINNRDLRSLRTDLAVTERLAGMVPRDRVLVSESGIAARGDVERLSSQVDAFLVGSSLMASPDPGAAARALAYGRVKVCGLTDAHDVEMAAAHGAAYAGMVMVPGTPRAVTLSEAEPLAAMARDQGLGSVAVFRNAALADVADTARVLRLAAVQLHGSEDAAYVGDLRRALPDGVEVWGASAVNGVAAPRDGVDRTLYDSKVAGRSGGTGVPFDWHKLAGLDLSDAFVAGGLSAANAARASRLGAYGLDVGSGVEMAPGRKDAGRMAAFFDALRLPSRQENTPCD